MVITESAEEIIETDMIEITNTIEIEAQIEIITDLNGTRDTIEIVIVIEEATEIEIMINEIEMTEEGETDHQEDVIGLGLLIGGREKEIVLLIGKYKLSSNLCAYSLVLKRRTI